MIMIKSMLYNQDLIRFFLKKNQAKIKLQKIDYLFLEKLEINIQKCKMFKILFACLPDKFLFYLTFCFISKLTDNEWWQSNGWRKENAIKSKRKKEDTIAETNHL